MKLYKYMYNVNFEEKFTSDTGLKDFQKHMTGCMMGTISTVNLCQTLKLVDTPLPEHTVLHETNIRPHTCTRYSSPLLYISVLNNPQNTKN